MQTSSQTVNLDYRTMLRVELRERHQRNSSYSLRSFAMQLGVSPAYLSQIFSSKRTLSEKIGIRLSKKLRWPNEKRVLFLNLIRYQRTQDEDLRTLILKNVNLLSDLNYAEVKLESFELISEWYHAALVELVETKNFSSSPNKIAKKLGISVEQAEDAVKRLLRLGILLKKDGELLKTNDFSQVVGAPVEAIQSFHKQHLNHALTAMLNQDPSEREISGVTMALDKEQLPELRELIVEFQNRLTNICNVAKSKDSVYHLAMQFYRLDKP